MKTAQDTLEKHCPSMNNLYLDKQGKAFRDRVILAMEEYASQFKTLEPTQGFYVVSVDDSDRRVYKNGDLIKTVEPEKANPQDNDYPFSCYEIWRPNIPVDGCKKQCKECKEKEG